MARHNADDNDLPCDTVRAAKVGLDTARRAETIRHPAGREEVGMQTAIRQKAAAGIALSQEKEKIINLFFVLLDLLSRLIGRFASALGSSKFDRRQTPCGGRSESRAGTNPRRK